MEDDQVAEAFEQVGGEAAGVVAGFGDPVDRRVGGGAVAGGDRVAHLVDQGDVGDAEQGDGPRVADAVGAGSGDQLVEDRQGVPGAAAAGPHDQGEDCRVDVDALGVAELLQVGAQHGGRDQPERVVVGPRADGAEDFFRLGGREDELDELGRLLDELEQRVEAGRRDHVRLVDHVDLEAAVGGREERLFSQLTGVVDTAVAGRVDLDDVDRTGAVVGQGLAGAADPARVGGGALLTVERPSQDARAGGLAAATGAGEEVRVVEPPAAERLRQRLGDVLLADDLGERPWTVFPIEGERHSCHLLTTAPLSVEGLTRTKQRAPGNERTPRAPARARLSLLPSGPGEVHEIHAARGAVLKPTEPARRPYDPSPRRGRRRLCILAHGGFA